MSSARSVDAVEADRLDWIVVEADDGRRYRYRRVGALDVAEPAHIEGHFVDGHPVRAALVRDADGHPRLRQAAAGLPSSVVVEHLDQPTNPLLSVLGLPAKEEYALVV
ncbi:MAG TPA: hypothetical protein VM597_14765 [Gemmataceae bacterium]|jgi:hypothetical protein|nr:hypothetical protein [Gemmataceae bacterium]